MSSSAHQNDHQSSNDLFFVNIERVMLLALMLSTLGFGALKLSKYFTQTSPFTEALVTLSVFSVLGALLASSLLNFATSLPATGIRFLSLDASWDDSLIVRWAAMLQEAHDARADDPSQSGVSAMELQAALLLLVLGFVGMRLVHHGVVVLRLLKVARRNQHMMLKNPDQQK